MLFFNGAFCSVALPSRCSTWNYPKRVQDNGNKTDGFQDLLFKAYLISR
ncbi:DUF4865 family protein [Enterocloster clostridioformis]